MKLLFSLYLLLFYYIDVSISLQWIGEEEVNIFDSYRNVRFTRYDIPFGSVEVTWDFRPGRSPASCEKTPINVFLQYGSIPPINANNDSYPEDFYIERTHTHNITLIPDGTSQTFTILKPRHGTWYSGMFRPYEEGKIVQQGLFTSCKYFVSVSYNTPGDVYYSPITASGKTTHLSLNNHTEYIQFEVEKSVYEYTLSITDCLPSCDLQITYLESHVNSSESNTVNCSNTNPCEFKMTSPNVDMFQQFEIQPIVTTSLNVSLQVNTKGCIHHEEEETSNSTDCVIFDNLDRLQFKNDFNVAFAYIVNDTLHPIFLNLTNNVTNNLPFNIMPQLDMGGTLVVEMVIFKSSVNTTVQHTRVCGMFLLGYLYEGPVDNSDTMKLDNSLCSNTSDESSGVLNIPYPEPGTCFIALTVDCYTVNGSSIIVEPCISDITTVRLTVSTSMCYHGGCSGRGECKEYVVSPGLIVYSTCVCSAGWRGYGCTDDKFAYTIGSQLTEVLLLTLSNLFFLPGILLSLKRRYYVEALVYTYNMFFSTFYHACDGDREDVYTLCIMKYNVLSFCDFLGSVCSLWVTVVAMAKVYKPMTVVLQMCAPLFLVIGVLYDRTNVLIIAVPLIVAVILVAISWTLRCKSRNTCYPSWRRYIFYLLPGGIIAGTGAMLFAFAETDSNYRYIHSVWHMTLSLSIIFLLPPRKVTKHVDVINGVSLLGCDHSLDNDSGLSLLSPAAMNNIQNANLVL